MDRDDVLPVLRMIVLTALALVLFLLCVQFGFWLSNLPALCRDESTATGASTQNMALHCGTHGAVITIEKAGQSVIAVCRCPH